MADEFSGFELEVSPALPEEGLAAGKKQQGAATSERRVEARTPTKLTFASIREAGLFKPRHSRSVRVLDISSSGLAFESSVPYTMNQKLHLVIDTPVKIGIQAIGEVRYAIRWASNYRIGVVFSEIAQPDRRQLQRRNFMALLEKRGRRP